MLAIINATPLIALDAVVMNTETTSLDPAKARIIEVAAVRLTGGRVEIDDAFLRLVRQNLPTANLTSFRECTRFFFLSRQRIGASGRQPKIASIAK
jgi:DNA polymerase III epsilon subunit-like protein